MDKNTYRTGLTQPRKSHTAAVSLVLVLLIFVISAVVLFSILQGGEAEVRTVARLSEDTDTTPQEEHSALGFTYDEVTEIDRRFDNKPAGVNVLTVENGSQAQARGIRPGDVLTALNGEAIDKESLERRLKNRIPGATMDLLLYRSGTYFTVTIKPDN